LTFPFANQSIRIVYRDIGAVDSAMESEEKQPKLPPSVSELVAQLMKKDNVS